MASIVTYPSSFSVEEVDLVKSKPSMKVGFSLKKQSKKASLSISSLSETSPLRGTSIRPSGGQLLLSVNGDPELPSAATAVDMIASSSSKLRFLVCEQPASLCVQVVAAPFFKHSPGINFSSTRGRTLVTVSKIIQRRGSSAAFASKAQYLHPGDIVLAVNGIPVSKPEEADRALRMPLADGSVTVLHTIDMAWLRGLLMNNVDQTKLYKDVSVSFKPDRTDPRKHMMICRRGQKPKQPLSSHSTSPAPSGYLEKIFAIDYDRETQHMFDPEPHVKFLNTGSFGTGLVVNVSMTESTNPTSLTNVNKWYTMGAVRFMTMFNQLMDENLDSIEDDACEHAWRTSPQLMATEPLEHLSLSSSTRTLPVETGVVSGMDGSTSSRNVVMDEARRYAHPPSAPPMKFEVGEDGSEFLSC